MESSTEDNQIHRSVLLDHKMIIEGVQYHEKKELQRVFNKEGVEKCNLSLSRSIGDRTNTANLEFIDGELKDWMIKYENDEFKKDWKNNWHPMKCERSTGIMKTFFKNLDDFPRSDGVEIVDEWTLSHMKSIINFNTSSALNRSSRQNTKENGSAKKRAASANQNLVGEVKDETF